MGFMRALFGPSREEIWRRLAAELSGEYVDGGFWKGDKVQVHEGQWTITLDSYTTTSGSGSNTSTQTYTRIRAPYVNADGFRFTIYRKGIFTWLGKAFGGQDVTVGYPEFDEAFVIKGNSEPLLRRFFARPRLRALLEAQPAVHLTVRDDEGWFGADFPDGTDELYFRTAGTIREVDRLRGLFELFAESLDQLCCIGSAYEDDPGLVR